MIYYNTPDRDLVLSQANNLSKAEFTQWVKTDYKNELIARKNRLERVNANATGCYRQLLDLYYARVEQIVEDILN